jgi:endonuclease G
MPRRNPPDDDLQPMINAFSRLPPQAQLVVVLLLLIAGAIAAIVYFRQQHLPLGPDGSASPNLVLGNPSNASTDPTSRDNYLMVKPYYALSYNDDKGTPNWVSWRVIESDLGDAPRRDAFEPDTDLPAGFFQVMQRDYNGGGFDRGHMCPHSDRAANQDMSFATFVMSNIIPQAPNVNRKAWAQMEDYCRELVRQDHDRLYVIAGPAGQGGRGSRGYASTLADGRITVPSSCWKVVVAIPDNGFDNPSSISSDARVLSVEMPNDNDIVGEEWAQYRTTPARIERETGLHFFTNLNPATAAVFRNRLDQERLPPPRVHRGNAE